MKIYKRYLLTNLLKYFLLVLFVLTIIIWITRTIKYLQFITEYGLDIKSFIKTIVMVLPNLMTLTIPLSAFVSILLLYNKFTKNNELIILRNAGVTKFNLAIPTIVLSLITCTMLFLITLYLLPKSNREFESVKYSMKNSITNVLLRNDDSFNNFKNITIYTKDVNNDILSSLVIYIKGDKGEQDRIIHAERGIINGDNILLTNGNIQESGSDNGDHIKILFFKKYALNITEYYGLDTGGKFSEKLMYLHELAEIKNKSQKTKAEITKRVIIPLFSIVLAILSVTLMLNINFTRMENGRRLFKNYLICIVVFSTFFYSLDILERSIHGAVVMVLLLVFSITYSFIKLREDRILT